MGRGQGGVSASCSGQGAFLGAPWHHNGLSGATLIAPADCKTRVEAPLGLYCSGAICTCCPHRGDISADGGGQAGKAAASAAGFMLPGSSMSAWSVGTEETCAAHRRVGAMGHLGPLSILRPLGNVGAHRQRLSVCGAGAGDVPTLGGQQGASQPPLRLMPCDLQDTCHWVWIEPVSRAREPVGSNILTQELSPQSMLTGCIVCS